MSRCDYREALARTRVLDTLAGFDPHVAGTPPLGLDLPSSDIDVLCHAPDAMRFADALIEAFSALDDFTIWQWAGDGRPVVARFTAEGWPFEIFGAPVPVSVQPGWRHFRIEQRLLALGGASLREAVMAERRLGAKTEAAFARVLGLAGDPYAALLALHESSDEALPIWQPPSRQ